MSWCVALSPDGRRVATSDNYGLVQMWDSASGTLLSTLEVPKNAAALSVAFSADGTRLAVASADYTARVWDPARGKVTLRVTHFRSRIARVFLSYLAVNSVAFSPDGRLLATAGADGCARIWDAASGRLRATLPHEPAPPRTDMIRGRQRWDGLVAVAFGPGERGQVLTACETGSACVWDAEFGRELVRVEHGAKITAAAFHPAGDRFATAGWDGATRIWTSTGQPLLRLEENERPVGGLAFRPDGRAIAAGDHDGAIRLWDPTGGRLLATLDHGEEVRALAFAADGRRLAAIGRDGMCHVWSLR